MKVKGKRTGPNPNKSHAGAAEWRPYNQRALKVLIVGCGRVGSQVAADMDRSGHQVVGNGTDADVLRRGGVEDANGFVAVTEGDNRNNMAAQSAKVIFKVPRVVARIYDPERADAYEKLGLHTICPTLEGAKHIEKSLMEK